MKIVALNFGRPKGQTVYFLNSAIEAAQAAGAEVELIQMMNKKIERCKGCGACSCAVAKGKANAPFCILKDDLREVAEKVLDADAILLAAPVYVLAPPGQFFDFVHRFCVCADQAVMVLREEERKREGKEHIDPRFLKKQWIGLISLGGCPFHHWVSFGLPGLNTFTFSTNMKVVGAVDIHSAYGDTPRVAYFREECKKLGEHLVQSVGKKNEEIEYLGRPGYCPVCHGDIFSVIPGTRKLECPVCGITGELETVDGEPVVHFTEEAIFHSRLNRGGIIDHAMELHGNSEVAKDLYGDLAWSKPRNFAEEMPAIIQKQQAEKEELGL